VVAYLIFRVIILGIIILGIFYSFASDLIDFFIPIYSASPLHGYNTPDTDWGFDTLIFMLKYILVPAFFGLMFYTYIMAQKPEQPWR
jgi:hypothetical protein